MPLTLASNAITFTDNTSLSSGIIGTAQLSASAVTTEKIALGAVITEDLANGAVTPAKLSQPLTLATAKAFNWNGVSTNTFLDFENIPSWVKRITFMLDGISTNGTSTMLIQVGDGSIKTSNYFGYAMAAESTAVATLFSAAGCLIDQSGAAARIHRGVIVLTLTTGNTWSYSGQLGIGGSAAARLHISAGSTGTALSGTLDRIRLTTVNGSDIFDAGSVNIMYEG